MCGILRRFPGAPESLQRWTEAIKALSPESSYLLDVSSAIQHLLCSFTSLRFAFLLCKMGIVVFAQRVIGTR